MMDASRTSLPYSSGGDEQPQEGTAGPSESPAHLFTMQGILSDIQGMVERSHIINRTQHMDLTCLKSCSGESEIHLTRSISRALGCRYQPAQLNVPAMLKQLEEAKEYRRCVQEQVADMKRGSTYRTSQDPETLKTTEERWSVALLDAAATVQVKAAQLEQVTRYHKQMEDIRSFLERLAGEMEKLSLDVLGSSSVQAEKISALLQTMEQKKYMIRELLHSSSELSPHMREAESSGVLLAQLGYLQEEWRLLEGTFKRALRHATASFSQSSHHLKMAQHLQGRVTTLQKTCAGLRSFEESHGSPCSLILQLTCLKADLKIYNQLYLRIQLQSDTLCQFSLGWKEKEEMACVLQQLQCSLNVTKRQLDDLTPGIRGIPLPKVLKLLEDLATSAKHAENQIAIGQMLALFPEEAQIQMAEMRKLRSETLSKKLQFKSLVIDIDQNNSDVLNSLKIVEDLYEGFDDSSAHVLESMERSLQEREDLFHKLTSLDTWLADTHISKSPRIHIENASKVEMLELERQLGVHKFATDKIETQIAQVDILIESCRKTAIELSPAESRYLINRLSGLSTELDGLVAHERVSSWELEELIHERTSSNEELASIQASLKQISADLDCQSFPLTAKALSAAKRMIHMLMEHQFQVQELQHCQEAKRSSLLCDIGELQDRCKTLTVHAMEQDKYFHLLKEMEKSRHIAEGQIQCTQAASLGERFRLCQTLLVELPLVKTQCQEAADQLEVIAQNLNASQLKSERQRIQHMVVTLVAWEHAVTENIHNLESKLLEGLHFCTELPTMMDHVRRTKQELLEVEPVNPEEKAIDAALQRCWVILRNLESWMRVVEALGQKEKCNLRTHEKLKSLKDACMHDCHSQMENLAHAREALKDYHWAAQGAISFLHNAEATFLSAPGGFLDCAEEERQTQQALASLKDVLQAHISHLVELVPHQPCLSIQKTEQLHIGVLSHLLVGRATLEAQAQLRLEALERCARTQQSHWMCHKHIRQLLSSFEASLSECSSERVTSFVQCDAQQNRAKSMMGELHSLAGQLEDLRAGCPMQGCRAGKEGELSALWRHWALLCRGVGLLLAQSEQRRAEWRDITTSIEQCCSSLASHQAELPDSTVAPDKLLSQAKMRQAGLEQEQQSLASLEHRLQHALSLSGPQDPGSPGPLGQQLVKVQQSVRSLTEQNMLVVRAALAEEQVMRRAQEEIREVEEQVEALLLPLESCFNLQQGAMGHVKDARQALALQRAKLHRVREQLGSRYPEVPADIGRLLSEAQNAIQTAEEKLLERSDPFHKLSSSALEVSVALEGLKTLLDTKSPSFPEAQDMLKRVWDELDAWHSRLGVLESEAQDLAEERPQQGQLLMDRLSGPLQLYQDTAQLAEQRTVFLGRIPAFLQEFEDILHSATCWLGDAQSWISAPCTYSTARSLHSHAKSLQLVLEDSERTRATLGSLGMLVQAMSEVWDTKTLEERLVWTERQVEGMQHNVYKPMEQLLHTATEIDAMELEVKTMEKNVMKIRSILSSMSSSNISEAERLQSRQVILANLQSMQKTLEEIEQCKGELDLPAGDVDNLTVFPRAEQVRQSLQELQERTQQQDALQEDAFEVLSSEEEEDEVVEERSHSSSSDTLTCSLPEDPEESFIKLQDMETDADTAQWPGEAEDISGTQPLQEEPAPWSLAWQPWPEANPILTTMVRDRSKPAMVCADRVVSGEETGLSLAMEPRLVSDTETCLVAMVTTAEAQAACVTPDNQSNPAMVLDEHGNSSRIDETRECAEPQESLTAEATRLLAARTTKAFTPRGPSVSAPWNRHERLTESLSSHQDLVTQDEVIDHRADIKTRATLGSVVEVEDIAKIQKHDATQDHKPGMSNDEEEEAKREDEQKQNAVSAEISQKLTTVISTGNREDLEQLKPNGKVEERQEETGVLQESQEATIMLQELLCTMEREMGMRHTDSLLWLVEDFDIGQSEPHPTLKSVPSLEWLEGPSEMAPEEKTELRRISHSFLHRLTCLLDLGEERMRTWQPSHGRSQHFPSRSKKFLQVLGTQLAVAQHLFQREPEALEGAEEADWAQLELRARAVLQHTLEQEVTSQSILKASGEWEGGRGRMGGLLEELDAVATAGLPESEDEEELYSVEHVQTRLRACQDVLSQLEQSRAALGCLLDQGQLLRLPPPIDAKGSTSVVPAGGALELQWRRSHRRTEQEIERCQEIQRSWARLQSESQSLGEWLAGVRGQLETWCGLADGTTGGKEKNIHSHLTQLLDFSMEVEARAAQKASIAREGALLLGLREAVSPWLRGLLGALEVTWSQHMSDLAKAQERLQQLLVADWPPLELLSDLRGWVEKVEARLGEERVKALQATDATQLADTLQHLQELKVGVACGQVLLDFLWQSGPQKAGQADICVFGWERTLFAETLGELSSSWTCLQAELMSQIRVAGDMHHMCAHRERRLGRLCDWLTRQAAEVEQWHRPISQTEARKALLESQAIEERGKEVWAAVQELQEMRARDAEDPQQEPETEQKQENPSDSVFASQIEGATHACMALTQKVEALRPVLERILDEWSQLETDLREVSLHTTRLHYALQQLLHTPAFSPKQVRQHLEELQRLQEDAEKGGNLCAAVDQSYQALEGKIHDVTAKLLNKRIEGEQRRWKEARLEVLQGVQKTDQTLALWQGYVQHRDSCTLGLQQARRQWEELSSAPPAPHQVTKTHVDSTEKLQDFIQDLQRSGGDMAVAAQPLIALLEPLAANQMQAEVAVLSRDILLVFHAASREKACRQEDLELHQRFCRGLEALELQTQNPVNGSTPGARDLESAQKTLQDLSGLCLPLMELSELSGSAQTSRGEVQRLGVLWRQWAEGLTHTSDIYQEMTVASYNSQSFQQKSDRLAIIQRAVEEALESRDTGSSSSLLKRLATHQRLGVELVSGQWLLWALLRDSVGLLTNATGDERVELLTSMARVRESWQRNCVAGAAERRALLREELTCWRVYKHRSRLLWRVLSSADPQPDPDGVTPCTLRRLRRSYDGFMHLEKILAMHGTVYGQTLEAGRRLCASTTTSTESIDHERLFQELQSLEEAWEQTSTLLGGRTALVNTVLQEWSLFGDRLVICGRQLDDLKISLEQPMGSEDPEAVERLIGESEVSLGSAGGALSELDGAKTELWRCVAAGDMALLDGQLELLHQQWEELCHKVSSRRQEITDRLNAWTLFNDKKKELCDWLTCMEGKVLHHDGEVGIQEMVEKLKKDCMEEVNLFSENKKHLQQLGETLLQASEQAQHDPVHGSLQDVNQRWHKLFNHIQTRVRKLKETLTTVQQLDKNMSGLRSWLSRVEAQLYRPVSYSVCHHQEIQRRLAENQELQRDIEQHMEGVASVLSLCDVLQGDEDADGEGDSLLETSRGLDQRWRAICSLALDRRLRIEETWRLWCKFLDDYARFEDWLRIAERTAAKPNSSDVLYTVAKEELKKFESFQRQVNERLTQLELVNSQYRRLARENRTDRACQLKAMVHQGNQRWDSLHRRVVAILRRLKHFTGQREDFESTRESMLVWLTELDLQLTNVEHFSQSDVHHKIEQLNGFQKEITLNTERIDGLIVFGEGLIQKSSPMDAAVIEEELEELHAYCQEVFSRLVRFHQRLSTPPAEEPELFYNSVSLEESLELIGRPWLGRGSLPATPTHLLTSPMERSGRGTPVSVDSLPLEWDHTGDVGGSSTHEEEEEEQEGVEEDEEGITSLLSAPAPSRSMGVESQSPRWQTADDTLERPAALLTSTPQKHSYLRLMSECSGSSEDIKRVSLIQDGEELLEALAQAGLASTDTQPVVMEHWVDAPQVQSRIHPPWSAPQEPRNHMTSDLVDEVTSWLGLVVPELELLQHRDPPTSIPDLEARVQRLKEMQREFAGYQSMVVDVGGLQGAGVAVDGGGREGSLLGELNRGWGHVCTGLQDWEDSLRTTLMHCQEFHGALHSLLLWLAQAETTCHAVDISQSHAPLRRLQQQRRTLRGLQADLRSRQTELRSLQALWSQLQPRHGPTEEGREAQEKLHVTASKLKSLLRHVERDLNLLHQRLDCESALSYSAEVGGGGGGGGGRGQSAFATSPQEGEYSKKRSSKRERKGKAPPSPHPRRSFFCRVLRVALPLHLLLLLLLLVLCCLLPRPASDPGCSLTNNLARSFYPMLRYTNGPPPT
ncbi:unnamed protein product [Lota lota]